MKWQNRGHEFDAYADILVSDYKERPYIYIFGAGKIGKEISWIFEKLECLKAFIDNDKSKQISGYLNKQVISLETFVKEKHKGIIVIAAVDENIVQMKEQLQQYNFTEKKDFYVHTVFLKNIFPVISLYYYGKNYCDVSQISVTERCTLKCKKCAHACGYVDCASIDMSFQDVRKSADCFFEYIDFIREFVLIGGEPLLYKDLIPSVEYIGSQYGSKIRDLAITTNGTIMPSQELLEVCKKYDVLMIVSNYSVQIPRLQKKIKDIEELFNKNGIRNEIYSPEIQWVDYGFESPCRNRSEEELIQVFDICKTHCREVRGNKLYFCVMARSVAENMKINVGENDYLDLEELRQHPFAKQELLEFDLGYCEKGYLDMCNYCNGKEAFQHPIPAAEQMTGKKNL